jgi:signal transduction histidine kinase
VIVAQLGLVAAITLGMVWEGGDPGSALRHLYLLPAGWAALEGGWTRGCLIAATTGLVQALFVLPVIERAGLSARMVDGLVSVLVPMAFAWVVGRLRDQSRAGASRLAALLEIQRQLAGEGPLEERLGAVAGRIRAALGAKRAAICLDSAGAGRLVVGCPDVTGADDRSAAAWTLRTGVPVEARDLGTDGRWRASCTEGPAPVRGLVLPLPSGARTSGALALEWVGDLPPATRLAADETAAHLALGIENARLTVRQRGFARELESKVEAATRQLRDLDRAKSEFLSVVSHEMRTPLTALQGFSELLLSGAVEPERVRRCLVHLHGEAQRLGRIVNELLDLARIESGRPIPLRREPMDLGELVERNLEIFADQHRTHRFGWMPQPGLPPLRADVDALDRILKNLLANAVKYSPRGGDIRLRAGQASGWPGMIELVVEDEGVGIPADALPRIFDRYVRVPHPDTGGTRGLGLGLAVVRALAEAHGGSVQAESEPDRGSRFRVYLPL